MPQQIIRTVLEQLEKRLLGKSAELEYALCCLLARGHLLIEDVPGVGKTTLAKSLARCFDVKFTRIQFTSDLLPSDLTGVTIFNRSEEQFRFQPGPIFTNVLLTDEINRANPKTQSALLEAMHEGQVSHDRETIPLPEPFFVVATLNSKDHHGTFPLPESQLDRFLLKIHLGYPAANFEKRVIQGQYIQSDAGMQSVHKEHLLSLQQQAEQVHVAQEIVDYIYAIIDATRDHPGLRLGVSPRGAQSLYRASKALALVRGRDFVIPDDVRELTPLVCAHRTSPSKPNPSLHKFDHDPADPILREILDQVPEPR